ncbi:MAG: FAD-dependent oxidoreductase, partial [Gammaproteobacteria bacterium]|nr:FAD-dependent oxidoreductase [Gammaproteobacteria bacterium]
MNETVVIAGAGHAAGQLVVSLRQNKYAGRIVLVGDEPYLPYQRPPLSKKFLAGAMDADRLLVKPAGFYEETGVELRLDTSIAAIDRNKKCLRSSDDDEIPYDKLVLGLGSRARKLPVEGAKLQGVHYLRSIADVAGIREDFQSGRRLVVIGAGYIGLEVAAVAQQAGLVVTVIEMADRVMSRVVSPEISDFY